MRSNNKTYSSFALYCISFGFLVGLCGYSWVASAASEDPVPPPAPLETPVSSPSLTPAPTPSATPTTPAQSENAPARRDLRIPIHQLIRPTLGISLDYSMNAFGGAGLTGSQGANKAMAFSLSFEYQPAFIQSLGVIGLGPVFSMYPIGGGVTDSIASLVSVGGQARYQLRYFRNQFLVPVISYSAEFLYYDFKGSPMGTVLIHGPGVGLWFLLNIVEPSVANAAYVSSGITRTYLVAQWKRLEGASTDGSVSTSGGSFYFGLRFEF